MAKKSAKNPRAAGRHKKTCVCSKCLDKINNPKTKDAKFSEDFQKKVKELEDEKARIAELKKEVEAEKALIKERVGDGMGPKQLLDSIEDLGRENFEKALEKEEEKDKEAFKIEEPAKAEGEEEVKEKVPGAADELPEEENEEEEEEENEEEEEEEEENKEEVKLSEEKDKDDINYEEDPDLINVKDKTDINNEAYNGSIMFVIWDLFIPGMAVWLYKMTATRKNKAKADLIDRENLGFTDPQKEEMEKMGLAQDMARIIFEKMPKWVAFILIGFFFTYGNVRMQVNNIPDSKLPKDWDKEGEKK